MQHHCSGWGMLAAQGEASLPSASLHFHVTSMSQLTSPRIPSKQGGPQRASIAGQTCSQSRCTAGSGKQMHSSAAPAVNQGKCRTGVEPSFHVPCTNTAGRCTAVPPLMVGCPELNSILPTSSHDSQSCPGAQVLCLQMRCSFTVDGGSTPIGGKLLQVEVGWQLAPELLLDVAAPGNA